MSGKRLVLEIDKATEYAGSPLRANLSVLDEDGSGHGHRLFGPKFSGVPGKTLKSHVLDDRDRQSLRDLLDEVDGKLSAPDEAIEKATAAWWEAIKGCEGQSIEPAIRAVIEAALPLLKYEVQP